MTCFSDGAPYPELRIHTSALAHNLALLRRLAPRSQILIAVKANAYGCGIGTLFPFFQHSSVDFLGVANCKEAVELRGLGWQKPILLLGGFFPENLRTIVEYAITPSITDLWQVRALAQAAAGKALSVHIKLDLGMGRIGIRPENVPALIEALRAAPTVHVSGIFTHFPHAGPAARDKILAQNQRFISVSAGILQQLALPRSSVLLHAANSYAVAFFPETHHDLIRPGILFYGYYQSEEDRLQFGAKLGFQPCLELVATPISHRVLRRGDSISYGATYTVTEEEEHIAVLPLGYADGIPRALSNRVCFGRFPLRGRVTMDQIMLGNYDGSSPVRLLGHGLPSLEHWAELAHSFSYELLTHLGNRLQRRLV
ncbi:MAG: alanine racemase [Turneriella sp.]|nr:alanine racemase [Turneriella sp.]